MANTSQVAYPGSNKPLGYAFTRREPAGSEVVNRMLCKILSLTRVSGIFTLSVAARRGSQMSSHVTRLENLLEAVPEALVGVDQSGSLAYPLLASAALRREIRPRYVAGGGKRAVRHSLTPPRRGPTPTLLLSMTVPGARSRGALTSTQPPTPESSPRGSQGPVQLPPASPARQSPSVDPRVAA